MTQVPRASFDRAIESYSGSVRARAAAGAIPVVGAFRSIFFPPAALVGAAGSLADLLVTERATNTFNKRLDDFREKTAQSIERLGRDKLDKSYIESDAFFDWLVTS